MSLGQGPKHEDLYRSTRAMCEERLAETSIFRWLSRESYRLFPDDLFADLFADIGRQSVSPRIVAVVMVLQRVFGMSDREAVEAFSFDMRWKYAAGSLDFDHPGFVHTVLVDMRARLRRSQNPDRIFETVLDIAKKAGLIGRKRVLDSTALYDAVATQDTVTMIRSAIRQLLKASDAALEKELRGLLKRDDDYTSSGKPICDWDDKAARETLVDGLAREAYSLLLALDGRAPLSSEVQHAVTLLATVVGQDIEQTGDGFRIARKVAIDRVISTVDPEARHGHKTSARGFDGYKGHIAIDPDSEIIVATEVTAGNAGDGEVATKLVDASVQHVSKEHENERIEVYGDAAYGKAENITHIEELHGEPYLKVQSPPARDGMFSKEAFDVEIKSGSVTCPQGILVQIRLRKDGSGRADFAPHCTSCPLRSQCTSSVTGRTIEIHPHEELLQRERAKQKNTDWKKRYRSTRPKVERKFGHMMRRKHGSRRARVRGRLRVAQDFAMLAAAINLLRLARLGVNATALSTALSTG